MQLLLQGAEASPSKASARLRWLRTVVMDEADRAVVEAEEEVEVEVEAAAAVVVEEAAARGWLQSRARLPTAAALTEPRTTPLPLSG